MSRSVPDTVPDLALDLDAPAVQQTRRQLAEQLAADAGIEALETEALARGRVRAARGVKLYSPLYLSNVCQSGCAYCSFRAVKGYRIKRRKLTIGEAIDEASALEAQGIDNILLVTGDDPGLHMHFYLLRMVEALAKPGRSLWLEVPPQSIATAGRLVAGGVTSFVHYQETYDRVLYERVHPSGPKRDYERRFAAPERAILAGVERVGLGILLGLGDPVSDCAALIAHVSALRARYPNVGVSVSLPRLREGPPGFEVQFPISDETFRRVLVALGAMLDEQVDLAVSTREPPALRDALLCYGVTLLSAGSRTSPGAYSDDSRSAGAQFDLADHRSVAEVAAAVRAHGLELA